MPASKAAKKSTKNTKMSKVPKKTTPEKVPEVQESVVEQTTDNTVTSETTESNNVSDWKEVGQALIDRLDQCMQKNKEWQKEYETEVKEISKEFKQFMKKTSKEVRRKKQKGGNTNRSPSGFAKPANISDELANFLGVEKGTMLARTDVTKRLTTYIKEHDLQNPENKREIFPDEKLGKIIRIPEKYDNQLTYFNFQACFKHHSKPATDVSTTSS